MIDIKKNCLKSLEIALQLLIKGYMWKKLWTFKLHNLSIWSRNILSK